MSRSPSPRRTRSLRQQALLFTLVALSASLLLSTFFDIRNTYTDYRDSLVMRHETHARGLRSSVEKVIALGLSLGSLQGLDARCQEIVASDPHTAYCLITDAFGEPLFAHDPSFLPPRGVLEATTRPGLTLLEFFPPYGAVLDISEPIYDANDSVVGYIRLGFPQTVLTHLSWEKALRSLWILCALFAASFLVVIFFVQRNLLQPIAALEHAARTVSRGDFEISPPPSSTTEFEVLSRVLREMAASLAARDQSLRESMEELEKTNRLLQDSYEGLEAISSELRQSREMYRMLLEHASDAILVSDEQDRIVMLNREAKRLLGVSDDQRAMENLFALFARAGCDDLDTLYGHYHAAFEQGRVDAELDWPPQGDAPAQRWDIHLTVAREKSGRRLVQTLIRDVTRERAIRANLERSAGELLRLNDMKSAFLGLVSHELKTPLTILLGFGELLEQRISARETAELQPLVENLMAAAERLNLLIQDILDVSSLDARQLELQIHEIPLNELVREVVERNRDILARRRQTLELELAPDLPALHGDARRMRQVIEHLLNNAIKFTPDEGTLAITTRLLPTGTPTDRARSGLSSGRPVVELVVRDSGIGIALEEQRQVFEKFYGSGRIEEHSSGRVAFKSKGAGLGLAIVQGIVSLHGGEVWVETPVDAQGQPLPGSAFHVCIPLHAPAAAAPVQTPVAAGV